MGGVCPNANENCQISHSTTVPAGRGDGGCRNLTSILPEGREAANIQPSLGAIQGIPVKVMVSDLAALAELVNDVLRPHKSVERVRSNIVLQTLKDERKLGIG